MFLGSGENHLDALVKEAILLQELMHEVLQTSQTKENWVKRNWVIKRLGGNGLPINLYSSNLEWSVAAQLICNLHANITIH